MSLLPKDPNGCPFLLLAPMEGVGDYSFRKAIASIGGFDEAVRDFIRVPKNAHVKSIAARFDPLEIAPYPLACQIMGSDLDLMADMAREVEKLGARRIDINCGCPSNTVTGRGAGSSLLKEPEFLHQVAKAVVEAVSIPVTVKMRSGFDDTSLFLENLYAAQESGIAYLTLHPRTKVEGYGPKARWELIAEAKSVLDIPVVGNGDILTVEDACTMVRETGCDALMIGRGAVINPFIFHQIRGHYSGNVVSDSWDALHQFFLVYLESLDTSVGLRSKANKVKQLFGFLFKANAALLENREEMLRHDTTDPEAFFSHSLRLLKSF